MDCLKPKWLTKRYDVVSFGGERYMAIGDTLYKKKWPCWDAVLRFDKQIHSLFVTENGIKIMIFRKLRKSGNLAQFYPPKRHFTGWDDMTVRQIMGS